MPTEALCILFTCKVIHWDSLLARAACPPWMQSSWSCYIYVSVSFLNIGHHASFTDEESYDYEPLGIASRQCSLRSCLHFGNMNIRHHVPMQEMTWERLHKPLEPEEWLKSAAKTNVEGWPWCQVPAENKISLTCPMWCLWGRGRLALAS